MTDSLYSVKFTVGQGLSRMILFHLFSTFLTLMISEDSMRKDLSEQNQWKTKKRDTEFSTKIPARRHFQMEKGLPM